MNEFVIDKILANILGLISALAAIATVVFSFIQLKKQASENVKQNIYLRRTVKLEYLRQKLNVFNGIIEQLDSNDFSGMFDIFDKNRWLFEKFDNYDSCIELFSIANEKSALFEEKHREPLRLLFVEMQNNMHSIKKEIDEISDEIINK